jgi:sirohydrochlorin ferrochelatase
MAKTRLLLVDNGSLMPEATLALRKLSEEVGQLIGNPVAPVSVLHSHKIPADRLNQQPAVIFEQAVKAAVADQISELIVLPLFMGPSLAITEFLPQVMAQHSSTSLRLKVAPTLYGPDGGLKKILLDNLHSAGWQRGQHHVLLCDHGSPQRSVTEVRNALAEELRRDLQLSATELMACSMERRPEPQYDFNHPLLAQALSPLKGEVIILMQFLLPGRHAGPQGDVAQIASQAASPNTSWRLSPLIGTHPALPKLLAERYQQARQIS